MVLVLVEAMVDMVFVGGVRAVLAGLRGLCV